MNSLCLTLYGSIQVKLQALEVTCFRIQEVKIPYILIEEMQIPAWKEMPWQEDTCQDGLGSNPGASKRLQLLNIIQSVVLGPSCGRICTLIKSEL